MEPQKTMFEMSIDTRMLYDLLLKSEIGEMVSFTRMGEVMGREVHGDDPNLQSALRKALNQDGAVFANIRAKGYKRLTDVEIVGTGERERDRIRRSSKRAAKRLTCVRDFDSLPNEQKIKHNTYLSMFGALAAMLKPASVRKLESEVQKASAQLPLAKTLEAFKG